MVAERSSGEIATPRAGLSVPEVFVVHVFDLVGVEARVDLRGKRFGSPAAGPRRPPLQNVVTPIGATTCLRSNFSKRHSILFGKSSIRSDL